MFQAHIIIGIKIVKARNMMAFRQESAGNVKADKPRRAGDEDP